MHSRPPIAQNPPNPPLATGLAINFNAQAQAQIGLNQQQQYPVRPAMVNIPPPPPLPPPPAMINVAQAQTNVDAANLATAAVIVGSAVGAAFHHENSQPQHGHTQSDHTSHSDSYGGGNHGYATEHHHEQAYGSSVPATHTDNNYAADMTYIDNSNYSVNNTYIDNTEVVNNTVYIENSTAVVADTNYDNTGYAGTATYSGTEVTTNVSVDVDINSAVYTDSSVTAFSMDESINVASNSEFAVSSADYSGDGYGDFEF
ncbi:hypothetical protein F4680DRAFT_399878 [Xylaria scruposa]|nr:hypothetical protein F4680DRAFT_399878 [Xylaria scruposa]